MSRGLPACRGGLDPSYIVRIPGLFSVKARGCDGVPQERNDLDAVGEHLVTAPGGGAVAVWAASGLSYNRSARAVDAALYAALFEGGHRVLGDAVREAQRAYAGTGEPRYLLDIYNLLGDPETALR